MTTAHSPLSKLRLQAERMAAILKAAERGEDLGVRDPAGKIAAARKTDRVKFGIAMDDKVCIIDMEWALIRMRSEPALARYLIEQMRKEAP